MARERDRKKEHWLSVPAFSPAIATAAKERFDAHIERLKGTKQHDRMLRSWRLYYSRSQGGTCDETQLNTSGSRGEIINLAPATYRRVIQNRLALMAQTPPDPEPIAMNTDAECQAQCSMVLGLLSHYNRVAHLEELGLERAEMASVLSASYFHVRWDPQAGKPVMASDPKPGAKAAEREIVYEGDLVFRVGSPYEYAFDITSPDLRRPRWGIFEEPMDRYDLLATYGNEEASRRAIEDATEWSKRQMGDEFDKDTHMQDFDDSVPVFWVYAERSASVPNGRKALVCGDAVLIDGGLDEDRIGVFALTPNRVMMRPAEGHSNHFGGMPIADAIGKQISTILSNHANYGLLRSIGARESNVNETQLESGISHIDYDAFDSRDRALPAPMAMRGIESSPELFTLLDVLGNMQDMVQGDSAVNRGDPNATKGDSGAKVAALFAAAQQIATGDIRAKLRSDEEVFSFIVSSLRIHAKTDRLITIAGKNNTYTAKQFKGEDVNKIVSVSVRQANPARDTFVGRMQMAEAISSAPPEFREQMQALILTGNFNTFTDDTEAHRMLIERENESFRDLKLPVIPVRKTDLHVQHIKAHLIEACNPEVRANPEMSRRLDEHIAWHMECLMPTSKRYAGTELLMVTGQKPLPDPRQQQMTDNQAKIDGAKEERAEQQKQQTKPPQTKKTSAGMPQSPQMPKNPVDGQRMSVAGTQPLPEPQAAGPA